MGIVVSEDANRGRSEQEKVEAILAENDCGLVMVTLDQISVFLGSWWATSLTSRIQTFRSYANLPLTRIISHERASHGIYGFYFAGVPAWAMSTCISICRHHPLERLIATIQNYFPNNDVASKVVRASFTILHSATRGILLVIAMQSYMYSLLQSLHLIPSTSMPGVGYFLPLGEFTTMLLSTPPTEITPRSVAEFAWNVLKTPSLFYIYVYLRPLIEVRLYRLIRRRLPKPTVTDPLSIKVAFDNDLLDWMVPSLGRRAVEEAQRSNLSLMDDLLYEINALKQWLSSKFTFRSRRNSLALLAMQEEQSEGHQLPNQPVDLPLDPQQQHRNPERTPPVTSRQNTSSHGSEAHSDSIGGGSSNEGNQDPDEDNMDLLRRARNLTLSTRTSSPDPDSHRREMGALNEERRQSLSDTLLSRSPSPASSQSVPRVRAHLIHDSETIAMQLELDSPHVYDRGLTSDRDADPRNFQERPASRRSISELLETILSNPGQNTATILNSETTDSDGLSNVTAAVTPNPGDRSSAPAAEDLTNGIPEEVNSLASRNEPIVSSPINILPDVVEEPPVDDMANQPSNQPPDIDNEEDNDAADSESEMFPQIPDLTGRQNSSAETATTVPTHRVTILSALPVDSLASHLASLITTVLLAPMESFYLRSLAQSYLASKGAPADFQADIHGLGIWGGGRSRAEIFPYMGKMALMMGIQAAVNASVWGMISGTAIRAGRRLYGWGKL
ncbi:hypothetical protein BJY04DRAFT_221014 [Aspergillus karnatakaensis]|uniref:uncharacterized protein n=1 Tax=Aspergillus karnatakaensis TaxID=1810916 RepID=UPI003CCCC069